MTLAAIFGTTTDTVGKAKNEAKLHMTVEQISRKQRDRDRPLTGDSVNENFFHMQFI